MQIKQAFDGRFYISTDNGMRSEYLCRDGIVRRNCNESTETSGWYDSFGEAQTTLDRYKNKQKQKTDSVKLNVVEEVTVKKNYTVSLNLTIEQAIEIASCIGKLKTGITFPIYNELVNILGSAAYTNGTVQEIEQNAKRFVKNR